MAGIGFELEKFVRRDTYLSDTLSLTGAGLVFSGPWAYGCLAIVALHILAGHQLNPFDRNLFYTMLTYSYAGAMILTGLLTFVVARFLADRIYEQEIRSIGPTYAAAWILHLVLAATLGTVFYSLNPLPPSVKILGVLLLVACTQLWLAGAFVSMLRSYFAVAVCFLTGYLVSALCAISFGQKLGLVGYLLGFWLGLSLIALLMTGLLQRTRAYPHSTDFRFLTFALQRPAFVAVGFSIAAGIWVDKIIFWFSPETGIQATPFLRYYPPYDVTFVLASLTGLPGLAWLLMRVEQEFATNARHIYTCLGDREPFDRIHLGKIRVAEGINEDFWSFLRLQSIISLPVLFFAPQILAFLEIPPYAVHIFRYHCLASLGIVLIQSQVLYFFYFDLPGPALATAGTYLVTNTILTLVTVRLGDWSFGLGQLVATFTAVLVGAAVLNRQIRILEFLVLRHFARQSLLAKPN